MRVYILLAGLLCAAAAPDGPVPAPHFTVGDSWVFEQTEEVGTSGFRQERAELTIDRIDSDSMLVGMKAQGSPPRPNEQMMGLDWSRFVTKDGERHIAGQAFRFPLSIGKTWSADFTKGLRHGNQLSVHVHYDFRVIGWEDVTVPAGTFRALKVDAKGRDDGVIATPNTSLAGGTTEAGGASTFATMRRGGVRHVLLQTVGAYYYVPALRNFVMSYEEQYDDAETRVKRNTLKLVSSNLIRP